MLVVAVLVMCVLQNISADAVRCRTILGNRDNWQCSITSSKDLTTLPNTTKTLNLSFEEGSSLKAIFHGLFPPLPYLEDLEIHLTKDINHIQAGAFQNLTSLERLILGPKFCSGVDDASLHSLHNNTFLGLGNLLTLDLKCTGLEEIDRGAFRGLPKLTDLNLAYNSIQDLSNSVFYSCSNLQVLKLSYNDLRELNANTLEGLYNLTTLHLSHCNISKIDGAFQNMTKLMELEISYNPLSRIMAGSFAGLSSVKSLLLTSTGTQSIETGGFRGLDNLGSLYVRFTELSVLSQGMFSGLSKLNYLTITNNPIVSLETNFTAGLTRLHQLDLQNNHITVIEDGAFQLSPNIRDLYLHNNRLTSIKEGIFKGLFQKVIYTRYRINLSRNPWACDCNLQWFFLWLREQFKNRRVALADIRETLCHSPKDSAVYKKDFLQILNTPICTRTTTTTVVMETTSMTASPTSMTTRSEPTPTRISTSDGSSHVTSVPVGSTEGTSARMATGGDTVTTSSHTFLVIISVSLGGMLIIALAVTAVVCLVRPKQCDRFLQNTTQPDPDRENIYWEIAPVKTSTSDSDNGARSSAPGGNRRPAVAPPLMRGTIPSKRYLDDQVPGKGKTPRGDGVRNESKVRGHTQAVPHSQLPDHHYENKSVPAARRESGLSEDDDDEMVFENELICAPVLPDNPYVNKEIQSINMRDEDKDDDNEMKFENEESRLPTLPDNPYENKEIHTKMKLRDSSEEDSDDTEIKFENEESKSSSVLDKRSGDQAIPPVRVEGDLTDEEEEEIKFENEDSC